MKKSLSVLTAILFVSFGLFNNVFSAEFSGKNESKPVVLPVVKVPTRFTNEIIVRSSGEVIYSVESGGLYAQFTAGHNGSLQNIRLVINDHTSFEWDCHYTAGKIDLSDGMEDGVHFGNMVSINKRDWVKFFQQRVAMPAFEFQKEKSSLEIYRYPVEFAGCPIGKGINEVNFKIGGLSVTLNRDDFILPFPETGKFYLGMVDGKFVALLKDGEQWTIPLLAKPGELQDIKLISKQ